MQVNIVTTFRNSGKITKTHMHEDWEIIVWTQGEGSFYADEVVAPINDGAVFVIPAGVEHTELMRENAEYRVISIRFKDEGMFKGMSAISYTDDTAETLRSLAESANRLYSEDPVKNKRAVELLTEAICTVILERSSQPKLSEGIAILRDEINRRYTDPEFKVAERISQLGYNPDYMRRLFKSELGITPTDMLTEKRIENAKKLLSTHRTPELSVAEVAFSCGFYDSNYFTRVFKKVTGMLPTAYRKNKG